MRRVAVIGSGPAGVYATAGLLAAGEVEVDVFDRLPCPYGLVRYGVAPDHGKIKSVSGALGKVLEASGARFLGNVCLGTDLSLADLHRHYDAVLVAVGAAVDRHLGVPGEDLEASFSATDFVSWYSGNPDAPIGRFALDARAVAVVGVGNVAVDVARILLKKAADLRPTDVPDPVLAALDGSRVEDVYLLGRRGPAQAKFTTKELRELGELANVDVLVDASDLILDPTSAAAVAAEPALRRNLEVLQDWAGRSPQGRPRRLHLRFRRRPVALLPDETCRRVAAIRVERTALDSSGSVVGTGQTEDIPVQMVLRSVGYRGSAVPGLPFDEQAGVIPNRAGRVLRGEVVSPGEYVAGWIKRGPTGVIGTNKSDAHETIDSLLTDLPSLRPAPVRDRDAILELLQARAVRVVAWQGWRSIDSAEEVLGTGSGRKRVKIAEREELLRLACPPDPSQQAISA